MNLTKIPLKVDQGMTSSSIPVYLVISSKGKLLATSPVLRKKLPKLYQALKLRDSLEDGEGCKIGRFKIYRVHPNRFSEKQRAQMVGAGEKGEYRRQFVEEGLTGTEQTHRAKEHTALLEHEWAKTKRKAQRAKRESNEKRSDYEKPASQQKEPRFEGIEVKEIAKQAELEPVEIRKFLRAKKIGKRGGRYAFTEDEAKRVIRAVKKHYARRDA